MEGKPNIKLERKSHRGFYAILLHFHYDVVLVNICKQIGARWSQSQRAWYVPDDEQNRTAMIRAFKGHAWLAWPKLEVSQKHRRKKASDLDKDPLTPEQEKALNKLERLLISQGRSPSTVDSYGNLCKNMFIFLKKEPSHLSNDDVIRFQSEYLVRREYAESTQRQFATAVRYLMEANHMPWMDISRIKGPRKSKRLPKVLSRTEVMAILSVTTNLKHRTILSLMYSSGLRVGEVIDLKIADINLDHHSIHIKLAKGRKDRVVAMGQQMGIMLNNYINQYRPIEYLFNGKSNMQYTQTSVRTMIKRSARKAGIHKQVHPHMLRHSFATHMIEDGVNLRYVQSLLGHSRPETTQIYTHVATEHLMKLKNPFDALIEQFGKQLPPSTDLTNSPSIYPKSEE
ncbi:MAG: tyrosine-type recombinase/integrase [Cryomorphaceae bacterium]